MTHHGVRASDKPQRKAPQIVWHGKGQDHCDWYRAHARMLAARLLCQTSLGCRHRGLQTTLCYTICVTAYEHSGQNLCRQRHIFRRLDILQLVCAASGNALITKALCSIDANSAQGFVWGTVSVKTLSNGRGGSRCMLQYHG